MVQKWSSSSILPEHSLCGFIHCSWFNPAFPVIISLFLQRENKCSRPFQFLFRSQDIQVFVFLTIPWFTKSVTSWWVLVHETGCIFEYIFWITTHWVSKLGQLIGRSKGNNFQESFEQFGRLGLSFSSFSIKQPVPITQQPVMSRF